MYNAIVTEIRNLRPHPNSDNGLQLGTCWGNQVIVGPETVEGEKGVYFPTDGILSREFYNLNKEGLKFFSESKPRVRAQKFRGEKSDGFWCPMSYFKGIIAMDAISFIDHGYQFTEISGLPICSKYINPETINRGGGGTAAKKTNVMFKEHFDTKQMAYNVRNLESAGNRQIIITEKLHGTSQRVGHVKVEKPFSQWYFKVLNWFGVTVTYDVWQYLNGTRRVILKEGRETGGFYGDDLRWQAAEPFIGNLKKGETVYFEVVGYGPSGAAIMAPGDGEKLGKDFVKQYGKQINWNYGCGIGEHDIYVYRITLTNEDGHSLDYSWEDVKVRCDELGVKHVPDIIVFGSYPELKQYLGCNNAEFEEVFLRYIEQQSQGCSQISPTQLKEGVCVRVEGGLEPSVYKHKSFEFKVLEGIIKDTGVLDMEEAS